GPIPQPPEPAESWEGVRDALTEGADCPQQDVLHGNVCKGDEDSLFLNIYTLQVMALRWVQQNISKFGGDPDNVTIFGTSAGGAAVQYHLLSPMSKGLFHRAIAQSGSVLNPWAYDSPTEARDKAFRLGQMLGLKTDDSKELLTFLQNVPANEIIEGLYNSLTEEEKLLLTLYSLPTCDKTANPGEVFLPDSPYALVTKGKFHDVPFLTGIVSHEGMLMLKEVLEKPRLLDYVEENFETVLPWNLVLGSNKEETVKKVKRFYFGDDKVSSATLNRYVELNTDAQFHFGINHTVRQHLAFCKSPTFLYQFSFDGKLALLKKLVGADNFPGACHGDDTAYIFNPMVLDVPLDAGMIEVKIIQRMVSCRMMSHSDTVTVNITQGALRGKQKVTKSGFKFFSFRGIPYAKPPVGTLRFKAPQPPESWSGVRDAFKEGHICPQKDMVLQEYRGNEDCLFLNVYTPKDLNVGGGDLKPVMVWFHGGGFEKGSGNSDIYGPDFLVPQDVVVITLNYRLGPFGFLCLDNEEVPGNAGLKDQVMALRWVQQNIKEFGGDPNNVTIFGESAGGASAHYHMLSPLSKGLFHRVISQSGTALCPWALSTTARERSLRLGKALGCETNDDDELLGRSKALRKYFSRLIQKTSSAQASSTKYLTSSVSTHTRASYCFKAKLEKIDKDIESLVPCDAGLKLDTEVSRKIGEQIRELYLGNKSITEKTVLQNPTPERTELLDVVWKPVEQNKLHCLKLDSELSLEESKDDGHLAFWDKVYEVAQQQKAKL
ncbi:hypothetical protein C0J52_10743, partial [Blattella germanica]